MTVPICTYEFSEGDVANYNIRFASIPLSIAPAFTDILVIEKA